MSRRRGKRILIWTGVLLGIVIAALAALPLWFPWILRPIANHYGLAYRSYERVSYARFVLGEVTFTNRNIRIRAQRVELSVPTTWAFRLVSHAAGQTFAAGENWELAIQPKPSTPARPQRSVHSIVRQVQSVVAEVQQWIPAASLTNGVIIAQGDRIAVPQLAWRQTNGTALVRVPKITNSLAIRTTMAPSERWGISIDAGAIKAHVDVAASSSNVLVKGTATAGTNQINLMADFGPEGVLPQTASIEAPAFAWPAEITDVESLAGLSGSARARWNDPGFEIDVAGSWQSRHGAPLPPLQFELRANGTTNQAEVSHLEITGPGITAKLSRPLPLPFRGRQPPAILNVEVDLSRQPWTNLSGRVQGQLTFVPTTNRFPQVEFSVNGANISGHNVRARSLVATGFVAWPRVELREASVEFQDAGRATLLGHANLEQKTIGHLELNATDLPQWVPANAGVTLGSARLVAQGPFTNLLYVVDAAGSTATNRWMNATEVLLKARGAGRTIRDASVVATAKDSTASMRFSGTIAGATNQVRLEELRFGRGTSELLRLTEPATITMEKPEDSVAVRLRTTPLQLRGNNTEVSVSTDLAWPERGLVACEIRNLRLQDYAAFLSSNFHALNINSADVNARWDNGPMLGYARLDGNYTGAEQFHASCEMAALENGVQITNLLVWSEAAPVVYARGTLPLLVQPAAGQLAPLPDREIDVMIATERDPAFWNRLGQLVGLKLADPEIKGRISGSWNAPKGEITATIAKIESARTNAAIPPITDIRLLAQLDRRLIRIAELEARIEAQPVRFSGQLPLREKTELKQIPDWTNAQGRLSIESASLAPFARYYPKLLAPGGQIDVEITLAAGKMTGRVTLTNATTQPLGDFGALRDVSAHLELDGRVVRLQEGRARLAGEPVVASGFIDLQSYSRRSLPPFQINVIATNVALVRKPETVIRSDLDIALIHSSTNPPVVLGTVLLRDGFYLSDLESLVPGSIAQPERRPPYFSVEAQPLADWQLNLNVTGTEFLKIKTPFLHGTASADFRLQGTLREPIAAGEARMNSGAVEFPFGTLTVKQARTWLTREQPFSPQIYMTAAAKRFGYDVTLEVTGTANKPVLQFSSVPSLTSEKIFLMLTAGQLPRDDITFSTQQKAQRFAVFVGSKLLNSLGFGGTSERLTIRSGEEISESGAQTYDVEYKLTDRWALVAQYDRFNAFNVSVKRRIFSR
jgi:translocation and assembly module TamB